MTFAYDGVPLLAMLDEYAMLRQDREEEKRRMRVIMSNKIIWSSFISFFSTAYDHTIMFQDQKRFHDQTSTEQEAMFGARPSPNRPLGSKKVVGPRVNGAGSNGTPTRRLSLNNGPRSGSKDSGKRDSARASAPANYVAISKEDAASHVSATDPTPASP